MRFDTRLGYHAPIKYCAINKGYTYTDDTYSINRICISNDDLDKLLTAAGFIQPYGNLRVLQNFQSIVLKIIKHVNQKMLPLKSPAVPEISCIHSISKQTADLIDHFVIAIRQKIVVRIKEHRPPGDSHPALFIHPYSLTFDQEHWYIIGLQEEGDILIFRKLDQIELVWDSDKLFKPFEVIEQAITEKWEKVHHHPKEGRIKSVASS